MTRSLLSIAFGFGLLLVNSASAATVTLQFSTLSAKLTNIQNAAGTANGGLSWGVVIDTTGNGFSGLGTSYDGLTAPSPRTGSGTFLSYGGTATDDFFYWGQTATTGNPNTLTLGTVGGTDGGSNLINSIIGVPIDVNGISPGDRFALIWLDNGDNMAAGQKYGFLTMAGMDLPPSGGTLSYSSLFAGADPIRLASNSFVGAGPVPEPSRVLFLALGLVGLVSRRRR